MFEVFFFFFFLSWCCVVLPLTAATEKWRQEIFAHFDGLCISSECKQVKPDREIYEALCSLFDLDPAETFFIDDMPVNIEGAANAGIDGVVCTNPSKLVTDLEALGIL